MASRERFLSENVAPFLVTVAVGELKIGPPRAISLTSSWAFTGTQSPSPVDQIPEGSRTGTPDPAFIFQGHFVDLRRLAFALTDRGYSLETACRAFGVTHGKEAGEAHGAVTASYIDYNRRDVLATAELAALLLAEYDTHPITLPATDVYTEYVDPRRDSWSRVQAILQTISLDEFERLTGKPRRLLIDARTGRRRPRSATRALLETAHSRACCSQKETAGELMP